MVSHSPLRMKPDSDKPSNDAWEIDQIAIIFIATFLAATFFLSSQADILRYIGY